jgi:hypothetical protein
MTTDAPRSRTISGGRIVLLVVGTLLALLGLGVALGGGTLLVLNQTQRDADGYFTTPSGAFRSPGHAITSQEIDLGAEQDVNWASGLEGLARIRVTARATDREGVLFIGIGPRDAVDAYLGGVPRSQVTSVEFHPFRPTYREIAGLRTPSRPGAQGFWAARAQGSGVTQLQWDVTGGRWELVVMNASGARPVAADVRLGVKIDALVPVAVGLLVGGLVLLAGGLTMFIFGTRARGRPEPPAGGLDYATLPPGTTGP